MEELITILKRKKLTLASCESVTGGDFASMLTDVSGASEVYVGGYVVYSDVAKQRMTNIPDEILNGFGAVSEETVKRLAIWTREFLDCDIAIAFSGNAGPTPSSNQPVGRIYTAIAIIDSCLVYQNDYFGTRKEIKRQTVDTGVRLLLDLILKEKMR